MIGAAPVPVPPPIPAVIKTISDPSNKSVISSRVSSADLCPTSGLPPAPSPLVSFSPIWTFVSALHLFRACLSVLTAINCTPFKSASIILLTALQPPPPTPMTLMTAELSWPVSNCSIINSLLASHNIIYSITKIIPLHHFFNQIPGENDKYL